MPTYDCDIEMMPPVGAIASVYVALMAAALTGNNQNEAVIKACASSKEERRCTCVCESLNEQMLLTFRLRCVATPHHVMHKIAMHCE